MTDQPTHPTAVHEMRRHYTRDGLHESEAGDNPIALFDTWFTQARLAVEQMPEDYRPEVNAMTLATVGPDDKPSARVVLLKGYSTDGFTFYTNHTSHKASDIANNPAVSLVFHWDQLERQIRIEGTAEKMPAEQAAEYFNSRPRGSRIGAWASPQSQPIDSREVLEKRVEELEEKFGSQEPPMPEFWGGYTVQPASIEFWQGRGSRLHDRIRFTRVGEGWQRQRLAP